MLNIVSTVQSNSIISDTRKDILMNKILNFTYDNPFGLILIAFLLGIFISYICNKTGQCSKNMTISLIVLPALVCAALIAVNGNTGASIAVLGVFSLVRFRSVAGSSRDIINVFFAMTAGLLVTTSYILIAIVSTLLIGLVLLYISKHINANGTEDYELKILVPEDVDFMNVFEPILYRHFHTVQLTRVKTTNMGALFELTYFVHPKANLDTKAMLDEIRTHNGNLNIIYNQCQTGFDNL